MAEELQQVTHPIHMISGNKIAFRKAIIGDLDAIKQLADKHRNELGFVMRPSLEKSIHEEEIIIAVNDNSIIGFVHYHHRRDEQTTLYHIVVNPEYRLSGIGSELITRLKMEAGNIGKAFVLLKCPVPLASNIFYQAIGFKLTSTETGKERKLNIWQLDLETKNV